MPIAADWSENLECFEIEILHFQLHQDYQYREPSYAHVVITDIDVLSVHRVIEIEMKLN